MFLLMRGPGRAGTGAGWVKCWGHGNLPCAARVLGGSTPSHCRCPRTRGMQSKPRGRTAAGSGVAGGYWEGFSPARSLCFHHGLPRLPLTQGFFARAPVGLAVSPALLLPNLAHGGYPRLISHNTHQPFSSPDAEADNGSLPCEGPAPWGPPCSNSGWSFPAPGISPKAIAGGWEWWEPLVWGGCPVQVSVHAARCGEAASPYRGLAPTKQKQNSV